MLSEALADGRLTKDEHSERSEAALTARTLGELAGLTAVSQKIYATRINVNT